MSYLERFDPEAALEVMERDRVVAIFADAIQEDDIQRLEVVVGDPRSQAVLEGLAVLVALRLFAHRAGWAAGGLDIAEQQPRNGGGTGGLPTRMWGYNH